MDVSIVLLVHSSPRRTSPVRPPGASVAPAPTNVRTPGSPHGFAARCRVRLYARPGVVSGYTAEPLFPSAKNRADRRTESPPAHPRQLWFGQSRQPSLTWEMNAARTRDDALRLP